MQTSYLIIIILYLILGIVDRVMGGGSKFQILFEIILISFRDTGRPYISELVGGCFLDANTKPYHISWIGIPLSHTRLDLYTSKPYQVGFLMFLNVLNERQEMNDER